MGVSNSIRFFPLSLLLSLVIRATTASCPDLATGDLIQTGIVSFASLNNNY